MSWNSRPVAPPGSVSPKFWPDSRLLLICCRHSLGAINRRCYGTRRGRNCHAVNAIRDVLKRVSARGIGHRCLIDGPIAECVKLNRHAWQSNRARGRITKHGTPTYSSRWAKTMLRRGGRRYACGHGCRLWVLRRRREVDRRGDADVVRAVHDADKLITAIGLGPSCLIDTAIRKSVERNDSTF